MLITCYILVTKTHEKETTMWQAFCTHHSSLQVDQVCLENVSPHQFWCIANNFPDLVSRLHVQIKLMGKCGLIVEFHGFPTLMVSIVFFCKESIEDVIFSSIVQN